MRRESAINELQVPDMRSSRAALRIVVNGQVQGVGFRPFVARLARQCRLGGSVRNCAGGVMIEIEGRAENIARFRKRLVKDIPAVARIEACAAQPITVSGRRCFVIEPSDPDGPQSVRVPADLATCADCRRDIAENGNRRQDYPFTNCTACGPRYSIVQAMPYDRPATAMLHFKMCGNCEAEYRLAEDRRFHAQPNACPECGPQIGLLDRQGRTTAGLSGAIHAAAELLCRGQIVALKGLGGFQLLVRADDSDAVERLRRCKQRPSKPLAVMASSLAAAEELALLGPIERRLLTSAQNPIVLADKRPGALPAVVSPHVNTVGVFLPTTPLHQLLLDRLEFPVVATSGNRSEEPLVTDERDAVRLLSGIADAFLVHNRPIVRRVDDSVVRVIDGQSVTFRLGRGYAPLPLPALETFAHRDQPAILATGGHQKTALALWTGSQAVLAQHIGDLDAAETRVAFDRAAEDLTGIYRCAAALLACDLHPDYFSSRWSQARNQVVIRVQHHHAHAMACMAEHDLLQREVLAITWDGTGYGPDGTIWGGELLRVHGGDYERVASLLPFPLPGGEAAIRHPGRIAFALLWLIFGENALARDQGLLAQLGPSHEQGRMLAAMISRDVQTPWTSSVGRLFDAVAALVLGVHDVSYEGEAALWLEAVADPMVSDCYPLPIRATDESSPTTGDCSIPRADWRPMITAILADLVADVDRGTIAARFHNSLAQWAAAVVAEQPPMDVVLSGGCFQNRLLTERMLAAIRSLGRPVFCHGQVPPGDGGLAAGQLAVALATRQSV